MRVSNCCCLKHSHFNPKPFSFPFSSLTSQNENRLPTKPPVLCRVADFHYPVYWNVLVTVFTHMHSEQINEKRFSLGNEYIAMVNDFYMFCFLNMILFIITLINFLARWFYCYFLISFETLKNISVNLRAYLVFAIITKIFVLC